MNLSRSLLACACALFAGYAHATPIVVFEDPDPVSVAPNAAVNLIVNPVDGFTATGDASRGTVGEVILDGANNGIKFVGFNPGPISIDPSLRGLPFEFSMDYFVPDGTDLDSLPDGSSPDLFWLQLDANGANVGISAGFIGEGAAGSGWNSIVINGTVPETAGPFPTDDLTPLFVMADGGFGGGLPNGDGVTPALYVDNFRLTVTIPEPTSAALLATMGLGLVARRRR